MKKKNFYGFIVAAVVLGFIVTACPIEFDSRGITRNEIPWGNASFSETIERRAWGYVTWVYVEVEFVNGFIENVNVRHNESRGHGDVLINNAIPLIIRANYFEIDVITGSSVRRTAQALLAAWGEIRDSLPE